MKYKKLTPDRKRLTVEFFWLPTRVSSDFSSASHVPTCFKAEADCTYKSDGSEGALIFKPADPTRRTGVRIESGDTFDLMTDDPVTRPLPSRELLEMQWILHRVRALKGAADIDDDEYGTDSEMGMELASLDDEESGWDSESATSE